MPCLPIKLSDCASYCRLLIRIHRAAITARCVAAVDDVLVLNGSNRALVRSASRGVTLLLLKGRKNLLPRHVVGELLAALGYAALLAFSDYTLSHGIRR